MLGYIDSGAFHGGKLKLDADAATRAIEEHVARPASMNVAKAADGIYQVINANMAAALSVVSVQRGYDPREFVLIVAGGAGPIHAAPIARDLEIPLVLIPRESSVFCAAGMLISDLKHDYVRTYARDLDKVVVQEVTRLYKEMTDTALKTLQAEGVAKSKAVVGYSVGPALRRPVQRGRGPRGRQGHDPQRGPREAGRPVPRPARRPLWVFDEGAPVELINLRVTARGLTPKPKFERSSPARFKVEKARIGRRKAWFDGAFREVPVYDGLVLQNGHTIRGPGDHLAAHDDDRGAPGLRSQVRRVQ